MLIFPKVLHPKGLGCPKGHRLLKDQAPHNRYRAPNFDKPPSARARINEILGVTLCGRPYLNGTCTTFAAISSNSVFISACTRAIKSASAMMAISF